MAGYEMTGTIEGIVYICTPVTMLYIIDYNQ